MVSCRVLKNLIFKMARRIKSSKPWPQKRFEYVNDGFRIRVDTSPSRKRRIVVLPVVEMSPWTWVLSLIDDDSDDDKVNVVFHIVNSETDKGETHSGTLILSQSNISWKSISF